MADKTLFTFGKYKRLPKSGQTISYRTGDDGDFEPGLPVSGPRFTDNGNGTVTDNVTGLMWVKEPAVAPGPPFDAVMTWNDAVDNCNNLNFAGYTDWRLPNALELLSIMDFGKSPPRIDPTFFPNTPNTRHWTSNTDHVYTSYAFYLNFNIVTLYRLGKTNSWWARPVRGGYLHNPPK